MTTAPSGMMLAIAIDSSTYADLYLAGTVVSAAAITLNSSYQVLEVGPTGSLTIEAAQQAIARLAQTGQVTSTNEQSRGQSPSLA